MARVQFKHRLDAREHAALNDFMPIKLPANAVEVKMNNVNLDLKNLKGGKKL